MLIAKYLNMFYACIVIALQAKMVVSIHSAKNDEDILLFSLDKISVRRMLKLHPLDVNFYRDGRA